MLMLSFVVVFKVSVFFGFCFCISCMIVVQWYGTVRYGTVRYGTVRYGTVRYGTVRLVRHTEDEKYGTVLLLPILNVMHFLFN